MSSLLKTIKWLFVSVVSALMLWLTTSYVVYRIPAGKEKAIFDSEIHYKFLEFNLTNRQLVEELMTNKIVRLQGHPPFYVSARDHAKLWPESPHDMQKAGYTFKAKLRVDPLLFGGYGLAEVISVELIEKNPIISK
jgi:hypothetical protein